MSFKARCRECADRLQKEYEERKDGPHPRFNDKRLCEVCHIFDVEEETIERIPKSYVSTPTDYL